MTTLLCKDCGMAIPQYEEFPGPRCLRCHARKFDSTPVEKLGKPDFTRSLNRHPGRSRTEGRG